MNDFVRYKIIIEVDSDENKAIKNGLKNELYACELVIIEDGIVGIAVGLIIIADGFMSCGSGMVGVVVGEMIFVFEFVVVASGLVIMVDGWRVFGDGVLFLIIS